jgi:carboxymethylenebutenolidase
MSEFKVTLGTSDSPMDLHGFVPDGPPDRRYPAVMVLQEAFGVNPHIKRVCRRVADAGYAAFSPELFHRSGPGLEFGYDEFPKIRPIFGALTNAQVLEDLRVAHGHISTRPDVDHTRIASWGFCFGGFASVMAACELQIAAAISFYGGGLVHARPGFGLTPLMGSMETIRCPVLLVYGAKDTGITPKDIADVEARLSSLGKDFEVEVYPNGGHGFFCEDRAAYDKDSAEAAWTRATAWLSEMLT